MLCIWEVLWSWGRQVLFLIDLFIHILQPCLRRFRAQTLNRIGKSLCLMETFHPRLIRHPDVSSIQDVNMRLNGAAQWYQSGVNWKINILWHAITRWIKIDASKAICHIPVKPTLLSMYNCSDRFPTKIESRLAILLKGCQKNMIQSGWTHKRTLSCLVLTYHRLSWIAFMVSVCDVEMTHSAVVLGLFRKRTKKPGLLCSNPIFSQFYWSPRKLNDKMIGKSGNRNTR